MAKGKKSSKSDQEHFKSYKGENRWEKNKLRKLTRHCKYHPEDEQASKVLEKGRFNYTRNSFKNSKAVAKVVKLKDLPMDERKSISEQMLELINSGELELTRK